MTVTVADLRGIDLFDGLDDEQLEQWAAAATVHTAQAGEVIAEQSSEPTGLFLVLEGTMETLRLDGSTAEATGLHHAPTWLGAITVLTGGGLPVRVQAYTDCRYALVAPEHFQRLVHVQLSVFDRVMAQIAPVYRRVFTVEANRERLESLGRMTAGLAHELNNPVAAARRAAEDLREVVGVVNGAMGRFVEAGVERTEAEQLVALQREALERAASATALDALDAADAEDALLERLGDLGVQEPWRVAEPLIAAGLDEAWLERLGASAEGACDVALEWTAATLSARRLAAELEEATGRMSSLIAAMKSYAYLDRGERVEVDLHEGIETTLTVLHHKLKHTSIRVERDYDRALPKVTVLGSQLNQVWTNLLDNAIAALGETGTISIATRLDGDCAVVEISDDGPGIPEDALAQIFDPFFTTKEVGQGTGLGLATARAIVVDRHRGSLTAISQPGRTTFRVRLPLDQS